MRATEVTYQRLGSLQGTRFDNVKIGITVILAEGETAAQGLAIAKNFVDTNLRLTGVIIVDEIAPAVPYPTEWFDE